MKLKPWISAVAVFLWAMTWMGCASTPKVDWQSRISNYTYDQAVIEMGPPDKTAELQDGRRVAEWYFRKNSGFSFGIGTGISSGNVGVGVGQTVYPGSEYHRLKLTFDPDGKLLAQEGRGK